MRYLIVDYSEYDDKNSETIKYKVVYLKELFEIIADKDNLPLIAVFEINESCLLDWS